MDLTTLYAYAANSGAALAAVLRAHPTLLHREFATTSRYNTIAKLLAHSTAAEERWHARLDGKPFPPSYEERAPQDLEMLLADAQRLRAETLTRIANASPESLVQTFTITLADGTALTLSAEDIFFHLYNHEQWHRAQLYTALQSFGIEPPNLDYVLWKPA
jgi:uncharacterized damage-inducible protein DinB